MSMYDKCANVVEAHRVPERSVFLWNAMIRAYSRNDMCVEAFSMFHQMKRLDVEPDRFTFPGVLKDCRGLSYMKQV